MQFLAAGTRLWADQSKTTEIVLDGTGMLGDGGGIFASGNGTLPAYPSVDFFVEGTRPSLAANDITIRASYVQGGVTVTSDQQLTVTPVVAEFSVTPKQGGRVTLLRETFGQIVGLNSGTQTPNGGDAGGGAGGDANNVGAVFTADLNPRTGLNGNPQFLQTVTAVTNGNPSGVSLAGLRDLNLQLAAGEAFPILNSPNVAASPFYPALLRAPNTADRVHMTSWDSPYMTDLANFNLSTWAGSLTRMDLTFDARLLLVWQFADGAIYTLGRVDWRVVFKATTLPFFGLSVPSDSVITANPAVITNADPARVTGSIYNQVIQWVAP